MGSVDDEGASAYRPDGRARRITQPFASSSAAGVKYVAALAPLGVGRRERERGVRGTIVGFGLNRSGYARSVSDRRGPGPTRCKCECPRRTLPS